MKPLLLTTAVLALFAGDAAAATTVTVNLDNLPSGFPGGGYIEALASDFGSDGPVTIDWGALNLPSTDLRYWGGTWVSGRGGATCGGSVDCAFDILVSDPAYAVTLSSFFLGFAFNDLVYDWSVTDLDSGATLSGGGTSNDRDPVTVGGIPLSSSVGFRVSFGKSGNIGINDIVYSYAPVSAVPLPGSLVLFGTALAGLAALRCRGRRADA